MVLAGNKLCSTCELSCKVLRHVGGKVALEVDMQVGKRVFSDEDTLVPLYVGERG
ncbi:hypothetical protein ANRL4_02072 [Anaerolineae bacterium]|nr:hypothetical protein ANRL4_02072 [Anaerolineae bacterium]